MNKIHVMNVAIIIAGWFAFVGLCLAVDAVRKCNVSRKWTSE